jgi:hypothetical protein
MIKTTTAPARNRFNKTPVTPLNDPTAHVNNNNNRRVHTMLKSPCKFAEAGTPGKFQIPDRDDKLAANRDDPLAYLSC